MEDTWRDTCFGAGSVAGAVIGTFLTTILLLAVAALLYRQWRRHKGKHLVLVTDPEIVEDAYAFDNPCFKDVSSSSVVRVTEKTVPASENTPEKDSTRWSTSWASLALGSTTNRKDKRRTLDDSCLGPKATKVSVVSLKSRDFTGLGFNVCGNMREGIFVKDLLHRGPASESGRIHPGDRIASVKISFRNMVYEDALTILSYASPYDVKLEVESGGTGSKPTTLLKKTVGPSAARICHPLYRSQSIPELSQSKSVAKRLFIADPNESGSNYSINSTLKSTKSTPNSQMYERRQEESKSNHHKFGIKVLPALDGTVHRIENQNEHNTNLERRHSKKMDAEKHLTNVNATVAVCDTEENKNQDENLQGLSNPRLESVESVESVGSAESVNLSSKKSPVSEESITIPSKVPMEVHNAAMAARRNRKNSAEVLNAQKSNAKSPEMYTVDTKSPQKNKRKAPPPPKGEMEFVSKKNLSFSKDENKDTVDSISDYPEPNVKEVAEEGASRRKRKLEAPIVDEGNSESDSDSEMQNSFIMIELDSADITIHRTPVPEANNNRDEEDDDVYRKAASLGDLSKYECRASTTLERAQSLDMTDTGTKKRKAPLPPEDINESTEDLTKLDEIDSFDRRKLKKSTEWGTLEGAVWTEKSDPESKTKNRTRKQSNGTLERSKSAVEIKLKDEVEQREENSEDEVSIELYNLPLSKRLTQEFIHAERMFNPDEDNSLAMIINDGTVVKSPTFEKVELEFRHETQLSDDDNDDDVSSNKFLPDREILASKDSKLFPRYLEKSISDSSAEWKKDQGMFSKAVEESARDKQMEKGCSCDENTQCDFCKKLPSKRCSTPVDLRTHSPNSDSTKPPESVQGHEEEKLQTRRVKIEKENEKENDGSSESRSSFGQGIVNRKRIQQREEDEDENEYEFGVTINTKIDRESCNVNNISVSSGENSEDSGLVGESMDSNASEFDNRPQNMTYITEIKVSPRESVQEAKSKNEQLVSIGMKEKKTLETKATSNGKSVFGRKPPVPPRKSDISKSNKEGYAEKQVVYVSEFKCDAKEPENFDGNLETKNIAKKFEQRILSEDREQNRRGRSQPQSITNIILSSKEDKSVHQ